MRKFLKLSKFNILKLLGSTFLKTGLVVSYGKVD